MEENNLILDEVVAPTEESEKNLPKKSKNNFKNNGFKNKECKVIAYNSRTKNLDINFDGYGIRIKDVTEFDGNVVIVKYKGEIGTSDFEYKL